MTVLSFLVAHRDIEGTQRDIEGTQRDIEGTQRDTEGHREKFNKNCIGLKEIMYLKKLIFVNYQFYFIPSIYKSKWLTMS